MQKDKLTCSNFRVDGKRGTFEFMKKRHNKHTYSTLLREEMKEEEHGSHTVEQYSRGGQIRAMYSLKRTDRGE